VAFYVLIKSAFVGKKYALGFEESMELRSLLRHCATRLEAAGSFSGGVIGICHLLNPSRRAVTLGSTRSLTEMTR
jgi:hypothetical protein